MQSQTTSDGHIIRIAQNEEIISSLREFCDENNVTGGSFHGLGAVKQAEIGMYHLEPKEYEFTEFDTQLEITNITGNIATKDEEVIIHAHATLADEKQHAFGGHLKSAIANPTCEIHILESDTLTRSFEDEIGLDLLNLS